MSDKQMNVLDILYIFAKWWKVLLGSILSVCIVAAAVSLLLPNEYEGRVLILPPKEEKRGIGFSEILAALPVPQLRLGERGSPADVFIGILKSDTVATSIVTHFDLARHYKQDVRDRAVKILQQRTTIKRTDQGLIQIAVLDRDRRLAADIANDYVHQLDRLNQGLSRGFAQERKRFLGGLMKESDAGLLGAKKDLQNFLLQHNAVSVEDQMRATIDAAAKVEMEKIALQFQLWGLQGIVSPDHPQIREVMNSIKLRDRELDYMNFGSVGSPASGSEDRQASLFIPLKNVPDLTLEYGSKAKEVLVQEGLSKYLKEQWLQTNADELNTVSTVQTVDFARPPQLKSKPKRTLIVLVSGLLSFVFSSCAVLGVDYIQAILSEGGERASRLRETLQLLRWKKD